jgi:hypothetical protein
MIRKRPKRQHIDLVHVCWGSDQGVVSLKQGTCLFYAWGSFDGNHSTVPTVEISDEDFRLVMEPVEGDPDCFEATWDDVPKLLNHRRFALMRRLEGAVR